MAAVEQHQQTPASPFTPPLSPPTHLPSSPLAARSPSPSVYDAFPLVCEDPPIRALTSSQYYLINEAYYTNPLPNDILFPWLHGVDGTNHQQNMFFNVKNCKVPEHRGLTIVQAEENSLKSQLVGSVYPSDILNHPPNEDENAFRGFLNIQEEDAINLRNFKIQVAKYATLSDVVVYGEHGLNDQVLQIAKQVAWAQQVMREERPNGIEYETFVIIEPFAVFEKDFSDLVAIDSQGVMCNKINFLDQEREEMRLLTEATEISRNVWLGNAADVPVINENDPSDSAISLIDDNPHQFSICIEAHDVAELPTREVLISVAEALDKLPSSPPSSPHSSANELVHLDCVSSGVNYSTPAALDVIATRMIDLCEFISQQANGYDRKILIYCIDGYTETSLLALTFLMYNEDLRLPAAYLKLQETRSFFVYPNDVNTLLVIEQKIQERTEANVQVDTNTYPWFHSHHFEGSFPSRILPFLYLGNLNHACNAGMLKALGITHVLSVGEDAKLNQRDFKVLFLDNLYDDGIDSLWKHLDNCVNFIENARETNGNVLIHCRVGVSRSATITIAYIMRQLGRPLVSSYLFVRARRLNVIIQPNLKFMYELLQYEQKLTGRMGISWTNLAKEIHSLNMCYVGS
ncbi:1243_t:CDS:2 [Ambispora gerdemannii]|uniref:1243_t:CDS:1 n=1 Tax=Ambispora gerdemannii TaxID=144530 RepID=A0A9N9G9P6_9GLOM|nr:1243_t:CDS:2 [Ambispora gerdemannii]